MKYWKHPSGSLYTTKDNPHGREYCFIHPEGFNHCFFLSSETIKDLKKESSIIDREYDRFRGMVREYEKNGGKMGRIIDNLSDI